MNKTRKKHEILRGKQGMSCEFCTNIKHINDIEKSMKHSDCFLFKDSVSNVGFGMRVDGVAYATRIDFCPSCGRKLMEEE